MRRRVKGVIQRSPRHRTYLLAGLLHCGSRGTRLHGQAADSRDKTWRDYRCRGCAAIAVVADEVAAELCRRITRAVLPADVIELTREELRKHTSTAATAARSLVRSRVRARAPSNAVGSPL